jgi:hypothetical protein
MTLRTALSRARVLKLGLSVIAIDGGTCKWQHFGVTKILVGHFSMFQTHHIHDGSQTTPNDEQFGK